jgi:hypothetical protein
MSQQAATPFTSLILTSSLVTSIAGAQFAVADSQSEILTIERRELAMETLGVNLTEGKALLAAVQDFVVAQQAREELEQRPT